MTKITLLAVLLAAPLAARADVGLRVGGDIDIAYHRADGTHVITDNWPAGLDAMLSYWIPGQLLSIDLEVGEQFYLNAPAGGGTRIGTVLRPGVRVSPPVLPLYVRGAIPINIENASPYDQISKKYGLLLGAGLTVPFVLFKLYLEADATFPLGGGNSTASAFSDWDLGVNAGLDFRF